MPDLNRRGFLQLVLGGAATVAAAKLVPAIVESDLILPEETAECAAAAVARSASTARWVAAVFGADRGFEHLVRPGCVSRFLLHSQIVFRPERLVIAGRSAEAFSILNLAEHGAPMFEDEVPADLFGPLAYGNQVKFDVTGPGETIVLAVRNISDRTLPLHASLVGSVLR